MVFENGEENQPEENCVDGRLGRRKMAEKMRVN
jgi:hypothetical protein